jgi:crotonobetainyl-CoA:carnitine CoA-transferase CaiB-like acyl-CoA transferase
MGAVVKILAALLEREKTGRGQHVVVSMTHNAHRLASRPLLTGGLACYRIYATSDERWLTVAALEPVFWARLVELLDRPDLASRHYDENQQALAAELAALFAKRTLAEWLELFDGEDVCVGPVATLHEASGYLLP